MTSPYRLALPDERDIIPYSVLRGSQHVAEALEAEIRDAILHGTLSELRFAYEMHSMPGHLPDDISIRSMVARVIKELAHIDVPDFNPEKDPPHLRSAFQLVRMTRDVTHDVWEILMLHRAHQRVVVVVEQPIISFEQRDSGDAPRGA